MSFAKILEEVQALHDKKSRDYGRPEDPYANVRGSEEFGIPAWVGSVLRANDKMKRLQLAARGSTLANEGIEDSLIDCIVYFTIALDLFRGLSGDVAIPKEYFSQGGGVASWECPIHECVYAVQYTSESEGDRLAHAHLAEWHPDMEEGSLTWRR